MVIWQKANSSFKVTFICLLVALCCLVTPSYADDHELISIQGKDIQVLVDPEHNLTLENIISNKALNWEYSRFDTPSYGFSPHTY